MSCGLDTRALDRYLTRGPWDDGTDEGPPQLRCEGCGSYLTVAPAYVRQSCTLRRCSGQPSVITCHYNDGTHEGVLAIIGEEYRHRTYEIAYSPECGEMTAQHETDGPHEIRVEEVEEYRHPAHFYSEAWDFNQVAVRWCARCGREHEETMPL